MNVLTVIVLLLILGFVLNGYRRGFIKTFASMFFFLLAAVLVYLATPYISQFLKEHTPVYEIVVDKCKEAFEEEFPSDKNDKQPEHEETAFLDQKKIIENLKLPELLKQQMIHNNNSSGYEQLKITGFSDYIASYMASLILTIISYIVTLFIVIILLWIFIMTLDVIANLPVLHGINRKLGLLLGGVQGVVVIWIVFLIITACSQIDMGRQLLSMIHESLVLKFLYEQNIFLKYLLQIMEKFS